MDGSARYPNYLCSQCLAQITDSNGRSIEYFNSTMGLLIGRYKMEPTNRYPNNQCFLFGKEYRASEGRFGGVIVSPAEPGTPIEETFSENKST